jgi:hypothetical protein
MYHRTSNRPFALIHDEKTGIEFWELWDERLPFGSCGLTVVALFHDFWFAARDDGDWKGPYRSREEIWRSANLDQTGRSNALSHAS